MPKSLIYKRPAGGSDLSFNMTPLIDCTFQLIIFFILTSQMASQAIVKLQLPRPLESQARSAEEMSVNRVIVNVLSIDPNGDKPDPRLAGQALRYQIDGVHIDIGDRRTLVEMFTARAAAAEDEFFVEIRADARVNFGDVEPIMLAAAEARISMMNITALLESGS